MRNLAAGLLVLFVAVLAVAGLGAHQNKQVDKQARSDEAALQALDEQLPIVDFDAPKPSDPAARAKRLAKDRRHNLPDKPSIGERFTIMTTVYEWPENFPPLPVTQGSTVIIGTVSEARAHLSDNKTSVYSEVTLKLDEVLKGTGIQKTLVAERDGGRVRLRSGAIFRYIIDGLGMPKAGHRYLLFLKQLQDEDFSIVTGYELLNSRVQPLDAVMPFSKYKDSDESSFLSIVRDSVRNQTSQLKD
jgi:hypothetical protein